MASLAHLRATCGGVPLQAHSSRRSTTKLPGQSPQTYAVYVDEKDIAWVTDWGGNTVFSFDARTEKFERHPLPRESTNIRQLLGRPGEVWLPESGTEHISVIRTA